MSRTHGSKEFWLSALKSDGAALLHAIDQPGVITAEVPSCPDWTVGDLTRHLGSTYHRTRIKAGIAAVDESWGPAEVPTGTPAADDAQLVSWFAAELGELAAHLDMLDPDRPTWNWAPQAKTAAFWHRRMANETAVHRWDAQLATGLAEPLETKLAGDTVAEALDTFLPAGRRRTGSDIAGVVQLIASDLGQEWYVRVWPGGVALLDTDTLLDDDAHPTRAVASGSASDLALALWGRIALDVLDTGGELPLLKALRVT